jgi:non-ribosomal peptide synthetase component F
MMNYFNALKYAAKNFGGNIAVSADGETITYDELISAAQAFGETIKAGQALPVKKPGGIEWFVETLGIMSAGAAAVPVSPVLPQKRADFILNEAENADNLPDGAALIYYTSGSTGNPKGVILTHTGILSLCKTHSKLFSINDKTIAAIFSDPGFDAFLLMSLPLLFCGATLFIAPDDVRVSLVSLHKFLIKNRVEITFLTTQLALSYMRTFDNKYLKTLLTGGEALRACTLRGYDIWNLYGPSESTVYVTAHKLTEKDALFPSDIPIGKPVGGNHVFLSDGIICISGDQLAAGYLNRPDETLKSFTENPYFKPEIDDPIYKKMYITGDKGELDENSELRFRGRADSQIKISGYRIEPSEIEAKIADCNKIYSVKVIAERNDNGEYTLTAFCVGDTDDRTLREELERTLPRIMIPEKIRFMSEIPTDPRTGKGVMIS